MLNQEPLTHDRANMDPAGSKGRLLVRDKLKLAVSAANSSQEEALQQMHRIHCPNW